MCILMELFCWEKLYKITALGGAEQLLWLLQGRASSPLLPLAHSLAQGAASQFILSDFVLSFLFHSFGAASCAEFHSLPLAKCAADLLCQN